MSIEDLMKPRYKVIADYPHSVYDAGDILYQYPYGNGKLYYALPNTSCPLDNDVNISDYPHLFKKLEWWEERAAEEMPGYVRFGELHKPHAYYKLDGMANDLPGFWDMRIGEREYCHPLNNSYPATEEE